MRIRTKAKKAEFRRRAAVYVTISALLLMLAYAMLFGLRLFHVQQTRADGATVVINELLWMGSQASSADEWIELRNMTNAPIDVSNWTLTKKSSGLEVAMLTIPAGKSIPANGYFLISNYANTNTNSTLNIVPDVVTTDVALANTALQIKLYDVTHVLLDTADDGTGNPLAGSLDSGKKVYVSMERNPVPGDGMLSINWHTASKGIGFKTGVVEIGTPGTVNSNGVPTANAGPDVTGTVGQELNFDGSDSNDPELQPLSYLWNFGDVTTSIEATPKHTFTSAGTYSVVLTVSDGIDSGSDTMLVVIASAPVTPAPVLTSPSPSLPKEGNASVVAPMNSCVGLRLSEILPNPVGVDSGEFVELENAGDEDLDVSGCSVFSNVTKSYKIVIGTSVPLHGFLLLPKSLTKLTLTNSGATIRLVDVDGTELDRVTYETAKEGKTWARFDDTWSWTDQPTPNAKNIAVTAPEKVAASKKASTKKTATTKKPSTATKKTPKVLPPPQEVTLTQVQELDSGDRVVINGVVTVPRDVLGSTMVFVQTADGGVGVSIPNGEPTVTVGQSVEVTGVVRMKQGRRQVNAAAHGVKIVSASGTPDVPVVATDDVGPDQADQLVHVKGVVGLVSGSRIEIDDGSGPVPIYIKSSTGIIRPKVRAGDMVDAVGITSVSTTGIRVLPRSQDDIHVEKVLGAATSAATVAKPIVAPASSKNQTMWYWVLVAVGALVVSVKPVWSWLKRRGVVESKQ